MIKVSGPDAAEFEDSASVSVRPMTLADTAYPGFWLGIGFAMLSRLVVSLGNDFRNTASEI